MRAQPREQHMKGSRAPVDHRQPGPSRVKLRPTRRRGSCMANAQLKEIQRLAIRQATRRERLEARLRYAIYEAVESGESFPGIAAYAGIDRHRVEELYQEAKREQDEES